MALFRFDATNNKLVPITSEGSVGIPVGAVQGFALGTQSSNWLLCDGRDTTGQADELATHYPALYTYLGNSNVLPDYRECVLVGVGQNDTDTIAEHDVYTLGEFKDDQFQGHQHKMGNGLVDGCYTTSGLAGGVNNTQIYGKTLPNTNGITSDGTNGTPRTGTTTHGKQKGVAFYIKATSAGIEVDKDLYATKGYVNDAVSYSTTEQLTGGKWIDGKPIYRLVSVANRTLDGNEVVVTGVFSQAIADRVDTLIKFTVVGGRTAYPGQLGSAPMTVTFNAWQSTSDNKNIICNADNLIYSTSVIVEYTKTTD